MHQYTVCASSDTYVLKFSQHFRKILFQGSLRREHGWTAAEPRVESWGGGVWEELFHPFLPAINASNVDCFGKHIFCQLHPLCPASWHSHLGNHSSLFGTITCTPHILPQMEFSHYITKVQNLHVLKAYIKINTYLCTHTHTHVHLQPKKLIWTLKISEFLLLPLSNWKPELIFKANCPLIPRLLHLRVNIILHLLSSCLKSSLHQKDRFNNS